MKILITGGFGFIGGNLISNFYKNHEIIVSSRRETIPNSFNKFNGLKLIGHNDLLSKNKFPKNIDTVIHLANLNAKDSFKFPATAIDVNIEQSRLIFNNAIDNGVKHIIYFSTSQVYGSFLVGKISEQSITNPENLYSITHKAAEDLLKLCCYGNLNTKFSIVRLSNSFGAPVDLNTNIWDIFVNNLSKECSKFKTMTIKSNPSILKDFVPIRDVVDCINFLMFNTSKSGLYNLSSETSQTLIQMANMIKSSYLNIYKNKILKINWDKSINKSQNSYCFVNKNLSEIGFKSKKSFKEEINDLLIFCDNNF